MTKETRTLDSVANMVNEHSKTINLIAEKYNIKRKEIQELKEEILFLKKVNNSLTDVVSHILERIDPEGYDKSRKSLDNLVNSLKNKGYDSDQIFEGLKQYLKKKL